MSDLPFWVYDIILIVLLGLIYTFRKTTCIVILFRIIGGLSMMVLGGLFFFVGLKMMGAFTELERKAGAQVVFSDTPVFLGSPEAWVVIGLGLFIGGIVLFYSFFKRKTVK